MWAGWGQAHVDFEEGMSGPDSGPKDQNPDGSPAATAGAADAQVSDVSASQSKIVSALAVNEADLAKIDVILEKEDPVFTKQINEFKKEKIDEPSLEELGIQDFVDAGKGEQGSAIPLPQKKRRGLFKFVGEVGRALAKLFRRNSATPIKGSTVTTAAAPTQSLGAFAKGIAVVVLNKTKGVFTGLKTVLMLFLKMPLKKKVVAFGALALIGLLILVIKQVKRGELLPDFRVPLVPTVAAFPDGSWTYDPDEELEDFFSPLRLPEHVVLLEKMVVNIQPSPSSEKNPMGYFEFYLEADSQEAAIEIGDRQSEVSDTVQRTLEEITYDEMITPSGKFKMKLIIRQNVNTLLTRGRVRKVFIGSMVVKP